MKKLLYQFDTDPHPAVFDNVLAYDGGADHVTGYGGVTPANVGSLVDGAIFTRPPKLKKLTALFIGGSNMADGEALLAAVRTKFFGAFRVSVMLDSNGANTTAAAAVAWLAHRVTGGRLAGKRAVVLAGTGPVGQRAAAMLAREGARVTITGRQLERTAAIAQAIGMRCQASIEAVAAADHAERARAIDGAQIVLAAGTGATLLLPESTWATHPSLEMLCDANPTPPLGIEGIDVMDKGNLRHGKLCFGAIGFGALKLALHRACIARLFEQQDLVLDAEAIHDIAKSMVAQA
jgi:methylenetetrahydrofolate/methylenetetrahydromethanopterin dehydrogenase (NADP+)